MPEGWDQWGLVGAMILGVLGLFSWLLRTSYMNFISEIAAAREERKELARHFCEVTGNHFHEAAVTLSQLNQALSQHISEQHSLFSRLQVAIENLCVEMRRLSPPGQ
ncbi:MAG: hypothetical protein GTO55_11355 [Armatimonadetes bacterium]|nr:hypothetical protein [Armatimonadota bacterium]NIM24813.1 hypothetical protein [Armatimonadota bacterium]NIM68704.1 hypothetical protein [Armatimonadota bacterium]NIM76999.1 hypothetical protein [Armatimonadota bacterium]NIN06904.1 hypothetical protein [Armatimonadota bacterium]